MESMAEKTVVELAALQRPGHSLDRVFYVDKDIFERDIEVIFARQWLFVDHVSRIPTPGDFITFEIGGDSIVIVRGTNGEIFAHHNVCRHRGSIICQKPEGKVRTFTCPYHGWVYDLSGRLVHAKNMGEGFDRSKWGLHSCAVRVTAGLIFIYLGNEKDAPDFAGMEADVLPYLEPHGLTRAKIAHTEVYTTLGNWKLAVENFRECYHCVMAHPEYTGVNAYVKTNDAVPGSFEANVLPAWEAAARDQGFIVGSVALATGLQPYQVRRRPIRDGWQTASKDGQPVAPLMGNLKKFDGAETAVDFMPQFGLHSTSDHTTLIRFTPIDPTHTEMRLTWLVHEDAVEGTDYDVERLKWMWHVTTLQDAELIANNHRGVTSRHYTPGLYSVREEMTAAFIAWYLNRLINE